jgi:transcriptional regulator with XRE-family HTH domain
MNQTTDHGLSSQVADEVRACMARRRMSASKTAKALGWSAFYLSRRLNGTVAFDVNDLSALAELLQVPIVAFFEGPEMVTGSGSNKRTYSGPPYPTTLPATSANTLVEASCTTSLWHPGVIKTSISDIPADWTLAV